MKLVRYAIAVAVVMCMVLLAGCGTAANNQSQAKKAASKGQKHLRIGWLAMGMSIQWEQDMKASLDELAKKDNASIIVADGHFDPPTQLQQLDNMIAQHVDGIIIMITDQKMSATVAQKCTAAGIPLIAESIPLIDKNGNLLCPCVELDGAAMGTLCGNWLVNYVKDHHITDYSKAGLIDITIPGNTSIEVRSNALRDVFTKGLPGFPQSNIFMASVDVGTSAKGYNAAAALLTAHPNIKTWLAFGPNDDPAQGVVRALQQARLDKAACVVSVGGETARFEWKKGGFTCWKAAAYFNSDSCASQVMRGMMEVLREGKSLTDVYANHKKPGQKYGLMPFSGVMVTPANYKQVMGKYAG